MPMPLAVLIESAKVRRFVLGRPLVASTVTGVTSLQQLDQLVGAAAKGVLEPDILHAIDAVHERYPNPAP